MQRFEDWLLTFADVTAVTKSGFDYRTPPPERVIHVIYHETSVQKMLPALIESGVAIWGRRSGTSDEDLGYRMLTVQIDEAATTGKYLNVGTFELTEEGVLPVCS